MLTPREDDIRRARQMSKLHAHHLSKPKREPQADAEFELEPEMMTFFAGEYTTTWSKATGLLPGHTCGHQHRTREAAEKCAAKHYPWKVYALTDEGRVIRPENLL